MYLLIYYNPNKKCFYHKVLKYCWRKVGYQNRYGHELMYIIHMDDYFYKQKHKLMIKFLRSCIQFLENILKKMI